MSRPAVIESPSGVQESPWVPWSLFGAIVLGWGSTFLGVRFALAGFTVLGLVSLRNLLAGAAALLLARLRGEVWPPLSDWPRQVGLGFLLVLLGNGLTALAQRWLSTGVAGLFNATISLWIVLLACGEERLSRRVWFGLALGLLGVALLLLPGDRLRVHPFGFLCMMGSTFSFSFGAMLQRKRPARGGTFAVLALQMGGSGLVAALLALLPGAQGLLQIRTPPSAPASWAIPVGALVFLAAVPSLGAYTAFAALSRRWPPSRVGIYAVLTPVVAVVLGCLVLREPMTARMLLAMGIILAGVVLVQRR